MYTSLDNSTVPASAWSTPTSFHGAHHGAHIDRRAVRRRDAWRVAQPSPTPSGDERKADMNRDTSGAGGHLSAQSSIGSAETSTGRKARLAMPIAKARLAKQPVLSHAADSHGAWA